MRLYASTLQYSAPRWFCALVSPVKLCGTNTHQLHILSALSSHCILNMRIQLILLKFHPKAALLFLLFPS